MTAVSDWLGLLRQTADAVQAALATFDRWHEGGNRPDQYALDQVADAAALEVLEAASVSVLSEESGLRPGSGASTVIVDPVDGSTNASRGIPHYCVSLCVVEGHTPLAGLVRHLVSGEEFTATASGGAHRNGWPISPSGRTSGERAVIGVSGRPSPELPVWQVRVLGSAALDLCAVACGRLDAYLDLNSNHGVWDYAAGILICAEAGAWTGEANGRELFHLEHGGRRGPVAASTTQLASLLDDSGQRSRR
ncbi:MAG: inositol monophosphatase [Acidimicrobiales bacterium]|nr:inositol monophosphatase [Acidimicrobiales bacterium]MYG88499.1 inositol monophosphatase [Acidimicrobiales bacterium]MYI27692.1 inositol monophosphatase [Acidimicrobiales bacterium]